MINKDGHRLVRLICAYCGVEFYRLPSRPRTYCSYECSYQAKLAARQSVADRFWAKVRRGDDCWEWCGAIGQHGYGVFMVPDPQRGRHWHTVTAHRMAYELTYGAVSDGLVVCHICDYPCCVRPDYLFAGTQAENLADMVQKGRSATGDRNGSRTHPERYLRGESHPDAKLTEEDLEMIRFTLANRAVVPITHVALSLQFGVSRSLISQISRGEARTGLKKGGRACPSSVSVGVDTLC